MIRSKRTPSVKGHFSPGKNAAFVGMLILCVFSCKENKKNPVPAFYYWKTVLKISHREQSYLDSLSCNVLFVKFLDVARDPHARQIVAYSLLDIQDTAGVARREVIPVVFLTNEVFQNTSKKETEWLAQKVVASLAANSRYLPRANLPFREVQFDCDWTGSTRNAFFAFLEKMRDLLPAQTRMNATIRLHQFKFPSETGVPPVDRGTLMLYNTGHLEDTATINSIYDPKDADKYLFPLRSTYPLPLDVAFPLFSWALVFREGVFWKIIPEPALPDHQDTCLVPEPHKAARWYRVNKATFRGGHYLLPGDRVRLESVDTALIKEIKITAHRLPLSDDTRFIFYHLDTAVISHFDPTFLQKIF